MADRLHPVPQRAVLRAADAPPFCRLALCWAWLGLCLASCTDPAQKAAAELKRRGIALSGQSVLEAARTGQAEVLSLLEAAGATAETLSPTGELPLTAALRGGHEAIIPKLVAWTPDALVNAADATGRTPLSYALEAKLPTVVEELLRKGALPGATKHPAGSMIVAALAEKQPALARNLASRCGVGSPHVLAALAPAFEIGDQETVALLLAKGAQPSQRLSTGEAPIYHALRNGDEEMVRLLLAYGAVVPQQGNSPMGNPLILAIRQGNASLLDLVLAAGGEPNVPNLDGELPLGLAIRSKKLDLAERLLQRGADATPFFNAAFEAGDQALMTLLCHHGAGVNNADAGGDVPMIRAVRSKNGEMARFLLNQGADLDRVGREGQTPLALALATRQMPLVELFLQAGANPNAAFPGPMKPEFLNLVDNDYFKKWAERDLHLTPLMLAASRGDVPMLRLLLKHGAKRGNQTKDWKRYPINFACDQAHIQAAQLLLGRDPDEPRDVSITISLSKQRAWIYREGKVVRSTEISTGRSGFSTPSGRYVITDKQMDWKSSIYKVPMPFFMRLSCKDFGLHAGVVTGRPASHGCVRLPKGEAEAFYSIAKIGDPVTIEN